MKKEIYLEYERKEMRGSSDQTAMNNKHIKRFHFSISPPRSIRSGAAERSWFIFFRSNHCISKPSPPAQDCCHMQLCHPRTITFFVIFSTTTLVRWENVGGRILLPANLILRHFPFRPLSPVQCSESPFQSDHRSTCSRFNPPSLPTSSSFALTNYKRLARLWMAPKADIRWKVTLREI